jgi:uncharacterized protein (TIGR02687 family)
MNANLEKVRDSVLRRFTEDGKPVVFWHDPEREFAEDLESMDLHDITVVRLAQDDAPPDEHSTGSFAVKQRLAGVQRGDRYLLYAPFEEPDADGDWLLDVRLWAGNFRADVASLYLAELDLRQHSLREHLSRRKAFLASQQRRERLQRFVNPDDDKLALDHKMLAVVLRADSYERHALIVAALCALHDGKSGTIRLDDTPDVWDLVVKYDLEAAFWSVAEEALGYESDKPALRDLLARLLVTDFAARLRGELPNAWERHRLPPAGSNATTILCNGWRNNAQRNGAYDALASAIAKALKVDEHRSRYDMDAFVDTFTFRDVEAWALNRLRKRVLETAETLDGQEIRRYISRRQAEHWVTDNIADNKHAPRRAYRAAYQAIDAAVNVLELRNSYTDGFQFDSAEDAYEAYTTDFYRFDQLYRRFRESVDQAPSGVLSTLSDRVEACYVNWFLPQIASAWTKHLEGSSGLLNSWRISNVASQQKFYERFVAKQLRASKQNRVFVIVSDALRYEVAEELTRHINGLASGRTQAELKSQLGVLPSYTALGMAALLPGKSLTLNDKCEPLVDGKSTASTAQRTAILESVNGMALRAQGLADLNTQQGRELTAGKDVVYIYHNRIDAEGDHEGTEYKTFEAAREAIEDLLKLIPYVMNSLNASYLLITADHGFIYHNSPPDDTDRNDAPDPQGAVVSKKRYKVGRDLPEHDRVLRGDLSATVGVDGDEQFWVPHGTSRFHFSGGARFFHGGAMPQEVIVPVVQIKRVRNPEAEGTVVRRVGVSVMGSTHTITTAQHRFRLIQTEAVSERFKPVTLRVGVYEGGAPVTDVQAVTFDSASEKIDDRTQFVMLTLLGDRTYSRETEYRLVGVDTEDGLEKVEMGVTIDRAFDDDF